MATKANLELRLGENVLFTSGTHDGYKVYGIVPELAKFLQSTQNPSLDQFKTWFNEKAEELLPYEHRKSRIGGVSCEVIIDVARKIILHTSDEHTHSVCFDRGCHTLKSKHNYQIMLYEKPDLKAFLASLRK